MFIYVVLSLFIAIIMDAYEVVKVHVSYGMTVIVWFLPEQQKGFNFTTYTRLTYVFRIGTLTA